MPSEPLKRLKWSRTLFKTTAVLADFSYPRQKRGFIFAGMLKESCPQSGGGGEAIFTAGGGGVRSVKGRDSPQRRLGGGQAAALPLCGGSAGRRRAGQTGVVLRVVKHLFARAAGVTLSARRCGAGWEVSLKWLTRLCVRGTLSPSGVSLI